MHQRLCDSKYLHDPSTTANHTLPSMSTANASNTPATATVAPQLAAKIDPSQAYSLGMSRRKLFMMQQMEDQRCDNADSAAATDPGNSEHSANPGEDNHRKSSSISQLDHDDSSDFTCNPSQYSSAGEKPCESVSATSSGGASSGATSTRSFECQHCDIMFGDCVMYTMHMGYHGFHDPLKCNMCGYASSDKVDFFLHIARIAHA